MMQADVLRMHVFPRLPIETRLALGVRPGRLDLSPYDSDGPMAAALRRRYHPNKCHECGHVGAISQAIVDMVTADCTLEENSLHEYVPRGDNACPVYLSILYHFNDVRYGRDRLYITVMKRDARRAWKKPERPNHTTLARMYVTPDGWPDVIYTSSGA